MKKSSKALRMAQPLAVVAVWAGLLGYVIPAAFSTPPAVTATAASTASRTHAAHGHASGSTPRPQAGPGSARSGLRDRSPVPGRLARQAESAQVRVIQVALRPHRVTVTLGRQALWRNQSFATVTPYRVVRAGTWTVRAVGASERATARVTLLPGTATTLVVLDSHGSLALSLSARGGRVDVGKPAARAAFMPSGSAPKPGRSPVPWLAVGGAGVLLCIAGAARLRQLRWARRVAAHVR